MLAATKDTLGVCAVFVASSGVLASPIATGLQKVFKTGEELKYTSIRLQSRGETKFVQIRIRLLPGKEWQVRKWSQPTPDTLEVNVIAPGSNPETLVSSLEDSPMFKGVTAELGRNNELTIKATITAASNAGNDTP